ncbi:MAG: FecR domain-containing protein [Candidatus Marinimicrobia bacterium]|nr:FecR domain-containing protein [Candidatus Neomarinimicrobiota bacterium]
MRVKILPLIMIILLYTFSYSSEKVALTIKSKGNAKLKRAEDKEFKYDLKIGTSIFNKDVVKTGDNGYAVIVFLDDKSQLKIRENTQMVIAGDRKQGEISKQINMQYGILKAEISKQRKGDFVIATPTSVASVKGTIFWVISDPVNGDIFYGVEGTVEVTNNNSGITVVVGANQSGTSTPDGEINVENVSPDEMPEDPTEAEEEEQINTLRIQLQNSDGDTKEIIIEYK